MAKSSRGRSSRTSRRSNTPRQRNSSEDVFKLYNEYDAVLKDVKVRNNQVINITASSVYYYQLSIGDNSKIIIDKSVRNCKIRIDNFSIGSNCEIIADGFSGTSGAINNPADPWHSGWWQASQGQDGQTGVAGLNGTPGTNGRTLQLQLGIVAIGNLAIHSNGGDGGNGGNGGKGQIGGNRNNPTHTSGRGGNGGTGGNAGYGGSGGNVDVSVWSADDTVDDSIIYQFISVAAFKGKDGAVGRGGEGAPGGNNTRPGRPGSAGRLTGSQGSDGTTNLNIVDPPFGH